MKILFCNIFKSYNGDIIASKMKALGHDVIEKTYFTPEGKEQEDLLVEKVFSDIKSIDPEVIFTVNVWTAVAKACHDADRNYVAWSYDSPQNLFDYEHLKYDTNHLYLFDRCECEMLRAKGLDTVYHMPLAVDTDKWDKVRKSDKGNDEEFDISFIGGLYESTLSSFAGALSQYNQGYLQSMINVQQKIYGYYIIDDLLTDEVIRSFHDDFTKVKADFTPSKEQLSYSIATQITHIERISLIKLLSDRYNFALVTKDIKDEYKNILSTTNVFAPVPYGNPMSAIFKSSKINLNPTLRIIRSGIPLRALDILGSGGFLLSSYQSEYIDYFEPDRDICLYSSYEEALEKADFFIRHDDIRKKVALNGYERVKADFTYEDRIRIMLREQRE